MDDAGHCGDWTRIDRMSHCSPGQPDGDGGHLHEPPLPLPHLLSPGQHGCCRPVCRDCICQPDVEHGPLDELAHKAAVVRPRSLDRHQPDGLGGQPAGRGCGAPPDRHHHAAAQHHDPAARGAADAGHLGSEHPHGLGALNHLELRVRPARLLHCGAHLQQTLPRFLGGTQLADFPYHGGHVRPHLCPCEAAGPVCIPAHIRHEEQPDRDQPDENHLCGFR